MMRVVLLFSTIFLTGILLLNSRGVKATYSPMGSEPAFPSPIRTEDIPVNPSLENGLTLIYNSTITVTTSVTSATPDLGAVQSLLDRGRDWLIISRGSEGVSIYDVSDPTNPLLLSTIDSDILNGEAGEIALTDNRLFVQVTYPFFPYPSDVAVIDITNLTSPQLLDTIAEHPNINRLEVKEDRLYVHVYSIILDETFYPGGTYVFSTNTTIPIPIGEFLTNLTDPGVLVTDDHIFFQARTPGGPADSAGIDVIDLSDPANQIPLGNWVSDTPGNITDLDLVGDYLYAAAYWGGVWVLDVSDLTQIKRIATFDWDDWQPYSLSLAVRPPHVILAQGYSNPPPDYKPHFSLLTPDSNQFMLDKEFPATYDPTHVSLADDWLVMEEAGDRIKLVHLYQVEETQKKLYLPLIAKAS